VVLEQRIESAETANIEVEVYTAEMVEDEIANGVGALDGPLVAIKCVEKPWVVLLDEVTRGFVCPEDVLAAKRVAFQPAPADDRRRMEKTRTSLA
jgi:hypothetical protein